MLKSISGQDLMKKIGHPKFYKLLSELAELHEKKTNNYSGGIPLQDLRKSKKLGIEPWIGILLRITHKFGRLEQIVKGRKIMCRDEKIRDTLMDIASSSLIAIILYEEEKREKR